MKKLMIFLGVVLAVMLLASKLFAQEITEAQAVQCILGEARGEPYEGQVAVGEVLRRRGRLTGFYGYTSKFRADKKAINKAKRAWKESEFSDFSNGATHFEGDSFKKPYWAKKMRVVAHIGHQTFYAK